MSTPNTELAKKKILRYLLVKKMSTPNTELAKKKIKKKETT